MIHPLNPEIEGVEINVYNRDYIWVGRPPLGLAYLAAVLRGAGHEVCILDRLALHFRHGLRREGVDRETIRIIRDFQPDLIGINVLSGVFSDAAHTAALIERAIGEVPLVAGGIHATVEPDSILREIPQVEVVFLGEAEETLLDFVNGVEVREIPGVVVRGPREALYNPPRPPRGSLDELPFPARDLLDMDFYTASHSSTVTGLQLEVATLISSRGCVGRCHFCPTSRMFPRIRLHSPEYVVREIEQVVSTYPVSCIVFTDLMFLVNRQRVRRFCELMIHKGLHREVVWSANARADAVDEETLGLMKEAGCIWLCFGFESGSQRMLDACNKRTTVAQNEVAARMAKDKGILVSASMIAGMPGETEEDFAASLAFVERIEPFNAGFNLFTPLPGSEFFYRLRREGKLPRGSLPWREVGMLNVGVSQSFCSIPLERLRQLIQEANHKISRRTNYLYYKYNFLKNETQALIRLRYNGQEPDLAAEPCYRHFRRARRAVSQGELEEAVGWFRRALARRPCVLNCPCVTGCPFYFQLQSELCQVLWHLGRHQQVRELCLQVLKVRRPVEGAAMAFFHRFLALASFALGREREGERAVAAYRRLSLAGEGGRPSFVLAGAEDPGAAERQAPEGDPIPLAPWTLTAEAGDRSSGEEQGVYLDCRPGQYAYLAQSSPLGLGPGEYRLSYRVAVEQGGVTVGILHPRRGWLATRNHTQSGEGGLGFSLVRGARGIQVVVAACSSGEGQPVTARVSRLRLVPLRVGRGVAVHLAWTEASRRLRRWYRTRVLPPVALLRLEGLRRSGNLAQRRARRRRTGSEPCYRVVEVAPAGYAIRGIALLEDQRGRALVTADVGDDTVSYFPLQPSGRLGERRVLRLPQRIAPIHLAALPDPEGGDRLLLCLFNFGGGERPQCSYLVELSPPDLRRGGAVTEVEREFHVLLRRDGICGFRGVMARRGEDGSYLVAAVDRDHSRFHLLRGRLQEGPLQPEGESLHLGQGCEPIGVAGYAPRGEGGEQVFYLTSRGRPEVLAVRGKPGGGLRLGQVFPLTAPSRSSLAVAPLSPGGGAPHLALAEWGGDPRELDSIRQGSLVVVRLDQEGRMRGLGLTPAGIHPTDVVAGDFDGDGQAEIAVLNYGSGLGPADRRHPGGVQIFKPERGGGFRQVAFLPLANPRIGAAVDVDRDGLVELVVSLFFERRLVVIKAV